MNHFKYFKKRKTVEPPQFKFEEEYWGMVKDPDGKLRNLIDEREKRYQDYKDEIDFINQLPAGRILDVGCGFGYSLSWVNEKWEKHGTELSSYAGKIAEKYCKVFFGKLDEAKYPDNYFDVVSAFHVLEHVEDMVGMVKEIYRILKDNGHLVIQMPNFDSGCARRFGEKYRMLNDKTHINLISDYGLRLLLEDHFFKVDRIEYPYFETPHFTSENLLRLFDVTKMSPPFYGNVMSFYARKLAGGQNTAEETVSAILRKSINLERDTVSQNLNSLTALAHAIREAGEKNVAPVWIAKDSILKVLKSLSSFQRITSEFYSLEQSVPNFKQKTPVILIIDTLKPLEVFIDQIKKANGDLFVVGAEKDLSTINGEKNRLICVPTTQQDEFDKILLTILSGIFQLRQLQSHIIAAK